MTLRFTAGLAGIALAIAGALLAPLVQTPSVTHAASSCDAVDPTLDPEEVAFYLLLNQYRADSGLGPVSISTKLTRAAAWHAGNMAGDNFFSHTDASGRSPSDRASLCGYPAPAGENIAAGTNWDTAGEAFEAWRTSPGHNENMLNEAYVQVGIGRQYGAGSEYGWYWATAFGYVPDGTDGSDIRIAESGIRSAGLAPRQWNVARVLPGGMRVRDLRGYTAWEQLSNGWWQQWGASEFVPGGSEVGLLPIGMTLDRGRTPR